MNHLIDLCLGKEISLGHMTVVEFFEKYYPDVKLNFSHLPCLMVGSQKSGLLLDFIINIIMIKVCIRSIDLNFY